MIPGRFHAETGAVIGLTPGVPRILELRDADGVKATEWYLPVGDTDFDIQVSDVTLPVATATWPSRITIDIVRKGGDRTARCTRCLPSRGSRKWADVFGGQEFVDPDDGLFYFVAEVDGTAQTNVGKIVIKGINLDAQGIHDRGGFNRWSDGTIR